MGVVVDAMEWESAHHPRGVGQGLKRTTFKVDTPRKERGGAAGKGREGRRTFCARVGLVFVADADVCRLREEPEPLIVGADRHVGASALTRRRDLMVGPETAKPFRETRRGWSASKFSSMSQRWQRTSW